VAAAAEGIQARRDVDWRKETQDPFLDPAAVAKRHSEVNVSSDNSIPTKPNKKK